MTDIDDEKLQQLTRDMLDQNANTTSLKINMRLQRARMEALQAAASQQTSGAMTTDGALISFPSWVNTASIGTLIFGLLLVSYLFWNKPIMQQTPITTGFEDIQLLSTPSELELFKDLDFYLWLSDETSSH